MLICGQDEAKAKVWFLDINASNSSGQPHLIAELILKDRDNNAITVSPLGLTTNNNDTFWVSFADNTIRKYNRYGLLQRACQKDFSYKTAYRPDGLGYRDVPGKKQALNYCSSRTSMVHKLDKTESMSTKTFFSPTGLSWDNNNFKFWICSSESQKISYPVFSLDFEPTGLDISSSIGKYTKEQCCSCTVRNGYDERSEEFSCESKSGKTVLYVCSNTGTIARILVIQPETSGYLYAGWPSWSRLRPSIKDTYQTILAKKPFVMSSDSLVRVSVFQALRHTRIYDKFRGKYEPAYGLKIGRAYLSFDTRNVPDTFLWSKLALRVLEKKRETAPHYNLRVYSLDFGQDLNEKDWSLSGKVVGSIPDSSLKAHTTFELGLDKTVINKKGRTQFKMSIDQEEDHKMLPDPGWPGMDKTAVQSVDLKTYGSCLVLCTSEFKAPVARPQGLAIGFNPYFTKDIYSVSDEKISISYKSIITPARVILQISDINSQIIREITRIKLTSINKEDFWKEYKINWDGQTNKNKQAAPGIYFLNLKMEDQQGRVVYESKSSPEIYIDLSNPVINTDPNKVVLAYKVKSKNNFYPDIIKVYLNLYNQEFHLIKRLLIAQQIRLNREKILEWDFSQYRAGKYYYTVWAEDDSGNQAQVKIGEFTVPEHKTKVNEPSLPRIKYGWEYEGPVVRVTK